MVAKVWPMVRASSQPHSSSKDAPKVAAVPWPPMKPPGISSEKPMFTCGKKAAINAPPSSSAKAYWPKYTAEFSKKVSPASFMVCLKLPMDSMPMNSEENSMTISTPE